ncbi:MAG: hypothetical protein A2666_05535 [Parcubacteria group bacterium RIFCSPHIGHO2_01_FULL_47_10b]|nr:MAG: hypothetical protein A2666_05535 [Parcubacteria group bacterium RIFCSPHIGHO2_01_FULL_47_10b]
MKHSLIIALLGFALLLTFGLATQSLPTHYAVGPNAYAQLYGIDDGDGNVIPYQPTKVTKPATTQTTTNTTKTTTTIKPAISDTELLKDVKNITNTTSGTTGAQTTTKTTTQLVPTTQLPTLTPGTTNQPTVAPTGNIYQLEPELQPSSAKLDPLAEKGTQIQNIEGVQGISAPDGQADSGQPSGNIGAGINKGERIGSTSNPFDSASGLDPANEIPSTDLNRTSTYRPGDGDLNTIDSGDSQINSGAINTSTGKTNTVSTDPTNTTNPPVNNTQPSSPLESILRAIDQLTGNKTPTPSATSTSPTSTTPTTQQKTQSLEPSSPPAIVIVPPPPADLFETVVVATPTDTSTGGSLVSSGESVPPPTTPTTPSTPTTTITPRTPDVFIEAPSVATFVAFNQEIAPEPQISFNQTFNDLHGTVKIFVKVQSADTVEAFLRKPGSLSGSFLARLKSNNNTNFGGIWDTTNTPNGAYTFQVTISNEYGEYKSQERTITIRNTAKSVNIASSKAVVIDKITTTSANTKQINDTDKADIGNRLDEVIRLASIRDEIKQQGATDFTISEYSKNLRARVEEFENNALEKVIQTTLKYEQPQEVSQLRAELQIKKEDLVQKPNKTIVREQLGQSPELLQEQQVVEAISAIVDIDNDGLSNDEELRRGTDILNPDSDGDGFIDGVEVRNGYDPTVPSPGDKVVFDQPLDKGVENSVDLGINHIELVVAPAASEVATQRIDGQTVEIPEQAAPTAQKAQDKVKLAGVGIPNSFITLYIYSTPVIVTVKTDALGRWSYELDKELDNGIHEAYVAITDNTGRVIEKSQPFSFVKTAQAISVLDASVAPEERFEAIVDQGFTFQDFAIITLVVIILAIILGLLILVIITRKPKPITK